MVDLEGIAIPDAQFDAGRDRIDATDFVIRIGEQGDVDITPGVSKYLGGARDGFTSAVEGLPTASVRLLE